MNYNRRPNRPDGNVYREMRRQKFRRASKPGRRGRGTVLPIAALLVVILLGASIFLWVH